MSSRPFAIDRRSFVDTAAYYALADADDADHARAQRILAGLRAARWRLVTTNSALAETYTLVLGRLGRAAALTVLTDIRESPATLLVRVTPADEQRAEAIIRQYTDKLFSYTDATSFAVMERLGLTRVFTFDRDFARYGFTPLTPEDIM